MALIRSSLLSTISGSIGGTTYGRNRGGAYARNRTKPINPNSLEQVRARSSLGLWSTAWSLSLTSGQRSAWDAYAAAISSLNRIGESIVLNGQQTYVRANTLLELASLTPVTTPPSLLTPAITVTAPPVYDVSALTMTVTLSTDTVGFLCVFTGPMQTAGSQSTAKGLRLFGVGEVDDVALTPWVVGGNTNARHYTVGIFTTVRSILVTEAGAVSNEVILRSAAAIA